ncbi:hypothetical protein K7X08_020787 [Anisodus acutangulus]|uniref:Uncharacterized protein n=1 Tax=Anisodus acutangulus TaxID=402998 RepID=A0A9Q1RQK5_9SOLA|nr:hypothetical protein K7X08_020787 [Anisodus acutangulus]
MKSRGGGNGGAGGNSQAATVVDVLAAGMSGLNFEKTGDDEGFEYGKDDFGVEHACSSDKAIRACKAWCESPEVMAESSIGLRTIHHHHSRDLCHHSAH